jgi:signal transduction histidine kinase
MQAAEEERKRWARELHDETLQGLGALRMGLSAAAREPDPERLRELVAGSLDQIAAEIQNLRAIITDLRPAALDQLGLRPALGSLIARVTSVEGLECEARLELPGALAPEVETTVYRLVQEALTNVARHARATRVTVDVVEEDGAVRIVVADDGRGFDPDAPAAGFGLRGMRERVQLAGGTLELATGEAGTRLSAVVPV